MNRSSVQVYLYGNTRNDHSNLVLKKHGKKKQKPNVNRAQKSRAARPALRAHSRRDRVQTEGRHGKPQTLREEENIVLELTQVEIWWSSQIKALRYHGKRKEKGKFLRPKRSLTFFLPKYHALKLQQQPSKAGAAPRTPRGLPRERSQPGSSRTATELRTARSQPRGSRSGSRSSVSAGSGPPRCHPALSAAPGSSAAPRRP